MKLVKLILEFQLFYYHLISDEMMFYIISQVTLFRKFYYLLIVLSMQVLYMILRTYLATTGLHKQGPRYDFENGGGAIIERLLGLLSPKGPTRSAILKVK